MRVHRDMLYYDPITDGMLYIDHHVVCGDTYDYFIRWKGIETRPDEVYL